jgi:hypothetical protein
MQTIHAIVFIQNWGDNVDLIRVLNHNRHVISVFHIMGKSSYLLDVNFDDKDQMEEWINHVKSIKLASGVPAVLSIVSQKVIEVLKKKEDFSLTDYRVVRSKSHFFMKIDSPHYSEELIALLVRTDIVYSLLHVQGETSYIAEVISDSYDSYKAFLHQLKKLSSILHLETQEVISVVKYRNKILSDKGDLVSPQNDIREIYTL